MAFARTRNPRGKRRFLMCIRKQLGLVEELLPFALQSKGGRNSHRTEAIKAL